MRTTSDVVTTTNLSIGRRRQGKVRDVYEIPAGDGRGPLVLMVASDRLSAFDVVLPTAIPRKGVLLTDLAERWFNWLREKAIVADHVVSTDPADVPGLDEAERDLIRGRMMLGRAARVVPIECVARGYLAGSGWVEYEQTGKVCGVELPPGLRKADALPAPIFTPATKAETGHDENIDFDRACSIAGSEVMERLRDLTLRIYREAAAHARDRGVLLADTKFEFGFALDESGEPTDELLLVDEVLTPDSSRYWPAERYEPGREQESFDKQFVRNYLLELVNAGRWDKTDPGPELPADIVAKTIERYEEARRRLFG